MSHCKRKQKGNEALFAIRETNAQTIYDFASFKFHARTCRKCEEQLEKLTSREQAASTTENEIAPSHKLDQ